MSSTSSKVLTADRIWLDGKLVPWAEGQVPVMTHALHYGLGVFEGIRAYATADGRLAIFRLRDHLRRFFDSAHIVQLNMPWSEDAVGEACLQLLRAQAERFKGGAYLRPIAFMGDGAMGLGATNPTRLAITAWDWGAYLGEKGMREGIRAKVSSFCRTPVNTGMARGKITGQYVNSILAKREAVQAGYDEAILLDTAGLVAEASGENVFLLNQEGWVKTPCPPPFSTALPVGPPLPCCASRATRWRKSPSPGTRCTWPAKSSSPAPPRKLPRCAKWTTARWGPAAPGRW